MTAGSTFDQGCVEGATGPLCATCKPGWVQAADLECTQCDATNRRNGKIAFGVLLGTLLVVAVLVATIGGRLTRWFFGSDGDADGDEVDQAENRVKKISILALLISERS